MGLEYYTSRGIEPYVNPNTGKIAVRQETPQNYDQYSRGPSTPEQDVQVRYQQTHTAQQVQQQQIQQQNVRNEQMRQQGIVTQAERQRMLMSKASISPGGSTQYLQKPQFDVNQQTMYQTVQPEPMFQNIPVVGPTLQGASDYADSLGPGFWAGATGIGDIITTGKVGENLSQRSQMNKNAVLTGVDLGLGSNPLIGQGTFQQGVLKGIVNPYIENPAVATGVTLATMGAGFATSGIVNTLGQSPKIVTIGSKIVPIVNKPISTVTKYAVAGTFLGLTGIDVATAPKPDEKLGQNIALTGAFIVGGSLYRPGMISSAYESIKGQDYGAIGQRVFYGKGWVRSEGLDFSVPKDVGTQNIFTPKLLPEGKISPDAGSVIRTTTSYEMGMGTGNKNPKFRDLGPVYEKVSPISTENPYGINEFRGVTSSVGAKSDIAHVYEKDQIQIAKDIVFPTPRVNVNSKNQVIISKGIEIIQMEDVNNWKFITSDWNAPIGSKIPKIDVTGIKPTKMQIDVTDMSGFKINTEPEAYIKNVRPSRYGQVEVSPTPQTQVSYAPKVSTKPYKEAARTGISIKTQEQMFWEQPETINERSFVDLTGTKTQQKEEYTALEKAFLRNNKEMVIFEESETYIKTPEPEVRIMRGFVPDIFKTPVSTMGLGSIAIGKPDTRQDWSMSTFNINQDVTKTDTRQDWAMSTLPALDMVVKPDAIRTQKYDVPTMVVPDTIPRYVFPAPIPFYPMLGDGGGGDTGWGGWVSPFEETSQMGNVFSDPFGVFGSKKKSKRRKR